jgi:hypothetical protein
VDVAIRNDIIHLANSNLLKFANLVSQNVSGRSKFDKANFGFVE